MFSLCQHRVRANALRWPAQHRRRRGRGRRHDRRVVRLLPAPGGPAGHPAGKGRARPGGEQPGRGRGPRPGRHPGGGPAGPVVAAVLPAPAGGAGHRLGVRAPGLPAAMLHRGRGPGRPAADGHAGRPGPGRGMADPGRGGRAQPHAGPRADAGRHVLRWRRLPGPAPERDRVRGGPGRQWRRRARADPVHRPAHRVWPGHRRGHQRGPGPGRRGRADRRPAAGRGGPAGRECGSRSAGPGTRSR